jgi:hypothetical protein
MKKLLTVVFTMLLAGSLAFAQDTGGSTDSKVKDTTGKKPAATPAIKSKTKTKGHKGGKKHKKGTGTGTGTGTTATQPSTPPK